MRRRSHFSLRSNGAIGYSQGEQRIFALLPCGAEAALSSTSIVAEFYGAKKAQPFHGRKVVIGLLSSIRRKAMANAEPFIIKSTQRSGPRPMSFWLEEKK